MKFSTVSALTPVECYRKLTDYRRTVEAKVPPNQIIITPLHRYLEKWVINIITVDKPSQRDFFNEAE